MVSLRVLETTIAGRAGEAIRHIVCGTRRNPT
jgi:hypothetical protein